MTPSGSLTGKSLGRYNIGPLLGRGGMGEVYRADDVELHRPVALKVLPRELAGDRDRLARFSHEARAASALNHPHLLAIYEVGQARIDGEAIHFLAMELVHGDTLRQVLSSRRTALKRTLEYLAQVAEALAAAHAAGIIHRDLKPENVMIAAAGYAKVLDFGLAKLAPQRASVGDPAANIPTVTSPASTPGMVMGTAGYMSPEQAQGLPIDQRSDIFSFGCILYEAAAGVRPFSGASTIDTLHKIIHQQPEPLAALVPTSPPELHRIVRKCLAKSPDDRYQSMKEVAIDLRDLRRELDSGAVVTAAPAVAARSSWRPYGLAAVPAAIILIALSLWLLKQDRQDGPASAVVIERLTQNGLVIDAAISPDANYLAYVESNAGTHTLWYRQLSAGRPIELVSTSTAGFWGIALSKDGTTIYYVLRGHEHAVGTLFSIPVLGGTPTALLSGIDSAVTFSPDGKQIAYYRVEIDGQGASSLMVAGADGSSPRVLVTLRPPRFFAPSFFTIPSWSPDGTMIAAAIRDASARNTRLSLFTVTDGREMPFPHRYGAAGNVRWLPDGSGILVIARERTSDRGIGGGQIWFQPAPSGNVRLVTSGLTEYRTLSLDDRGSTLVSVVYETNAWLWAADPDGQNARRLNTDRSAGWNGLALTASGRMFYSRLGTNALQLWSLAADGTDPREVVSNIDDAGIGVSADGQWVVYTASRDGALGIWRARSDGSSPTRLATVDTVQALVVSPDGQTVFFTSSMEGPPSTYSVPMTGGQPKLVTQRLAGAVVSPDGRMLAGVYRANDRDQISIGVIDAATGKPIHVFKNAVLGGNTTFGWTRDSRTVLYTTAERINLWAQPLDGGSPRQLTNYTDQWILRFAIFPDGKQMVLSRGTGLRDAVQVKNFR